MHNFTNSQHLLIIFWYGETLFNYQLTTVNTVLAYKQLRGFHNNSSDLTVGV